MGPSAAARFATDDVPSPARMSRISMRAADPSAAIWSALRILYVLATERTVSRR